MQNSKINTVLLVILIVLVAVGLWFMMNKKDGEESTENVKVTTSQPAGTVSENQTQNQNQNTSTNNNTTVPALKQYSDTQLHFSYAPNATVKKVKDALEVSVGAGDPYAEKIGYYVAEMPYALNNYRLLAPEKYGTTTFEVYQAQESGTKLYIVRNGRQAVIVEVPFSADGNGIAKYIDLSSISL